MQPTTVSARVPQELRKRIDEIAQTERRSMSDIVQLAIESFVQQYDELHPQFRADILEGLAQMDAGEVVPYQRG
ncbi:MAG TPA: ribbon-helix-helix protein, CopG family [Candidatus Acetothermia bacterium]|nr:ribbon-helix-helix protein, CopG family [Candidatus Acetothermia bacterium]